MRYFTKIYVVLVLMWGAVGLERLVAAFGASRHSKRLRP